MSGTPEKSTDESILRAFGALNAIAGLEQPSATPQPVLISDLVQYISGLSSERTAVVEQALRNNITLRQQYRTLLATSRIEAFARPRAAHSDEVFERRVGEHGIVLKLKASRARPDQFYLLVEVPSALLVGDQQTIKEEQVLVLHANTPEETERCVFPPLHDARTQIILEKTAPLFRLLQDHDVEIDLH